MCSICRMTSEKEICDDCQKTIDRGYEISSLAGRCASGAERDHGTLFHAIKLDEWKAVCGYSPGKRSAGWSSWKPADRTVTCPRCAKRLAGGSPAYAQFKKVKALHPDAIILLRLGNFYNAFEGDAQTCADELGLTITSITLGGNPVKFTGVPYFAIEGYVARLIEKGYRVALCDQVKEQS